MAKSDLVDIDVHLHHRTPKGGLLVSLDGNSKKAVWLFEGSCEIEQKKGAHYVLTLPESLALEKGLI